MVPFLRKNRMLVGAALLAAVALRLLFIIKYPNFEGDPRVYSDIASNWLHHGVFGVTDMGRPTPTYIRLPGYPAFLAACFVLFRSGDLQNILYVQLIFDLFTCLLLAALALEWFGERAAKATLWASALCPFTANYVALPMSETLSVFFISLGLYAGARVMRGITAGRADRPACAVAGAACACSILLRPDGGILLMAFAAVLGCRLARSMHRHKVVAAGLMIAAIAFAPLAPWTIRNWRTFHVLQPLAPRYANAPGEYVPMGFNHWSKTWLLDYLSVEEVFWKVTSESDAEKADFDAVPDRAFDSDEQQDTVRQLFAEYNAASQLTPQLDARFAAVAVDRIHRHPIQYFLLFPAARVLDMWFRPRTEMLPIDHDWWPRDPWERVIAASFIAANAALVLLAIAGWWHSRQIDGTSLLAVYVVLRSLFLGTIESPEPRYMLECFPVVLLFAGAALSVLGRGWRAVRHPELRPEVL